MKFELPANHGLSVESVESLVFRDGTEYSLTDVQFAALDAGVGRGESVLIVSPTSTGKTQVALWAIAHGLENNCRTVYLLTHRALARQKFEDFREQLIESHLDGDLTSLVIATGDYVETADGSVPKNPLDAPLLVATYEKYLALLSANGVPSDMSSTVVVCDEIQLIGDEHRGQNVEVLLTLLKNAGWRQFVGLSAVLQANDARDLAHWLGVKLVSADHREKHLRYECWTNQGIFSVETNSPETIVQSTATGSSSLNPLDVLAVLLRQEPAVRPIIVFCTSRKQTYDFAAAYFKSITKPIAGQLSLAFDQLPVTTANALLAQYLPHRFAVHSSDLTEEERTIIEQHLLSGQLDVVFATTTLAAGVNFPLGAAIIFWERWNNELRGREPISAAEFHNMAGRVGRMGFDHDHGRVIFLASSDQQIRASRQYLDLGSLPPLQSRIGPGGFDQLALQLVASGLCKSRAEVDVLVKSTWSGLREEDRNTAAFSTWSSRLGESIDYLKQEVLLIEATSGRLVATPFGKAVAHSGLLPETGVALMRHLAHQADTLPEYLPGSQRTPDTDKLAFLVTSACFSSPEFKGGPRETRTRHLPYQLEEPYLIDADAFSKELMEPVWQADPAPVNAAKITVDWINGAELRDIENSLDALRAGSLRDMFRNVCWVLSGVASIVEAVTDARTPNALRPPYLTIPNSQLANLRKLPRYFRRLSLRVAEGLPDDVLWMTWLNNRDAAFRLTRGEILALRRHGFTSLDQIMQGTPEADQVRLAVFDAIKPTPHTKANWLRDASRQWKQEQRRRTAERHATRAKHCPHAQHVETYYTSRGTDFEAAFEKAMQLLNIKFQRLDDRAVTGAPDYLLELSDSPPLILELKSKVNDKLVDYNSAVEVLAASEVHGYKEIFCVTLSHPGVDPSVPSVINACGRLSVVESHDLGEALLRVCEGNLTQAQLWQWLATPGQAKADDLPFRTYP
ncbi:DEAD/DEAH box helicase [Burkholderia pseudomallei]|uniref:DEAD/DEAH box helicase n=1 Tax=Burkholderia pseudomallei TaxID=28450 RepID=UPI0024A8BCDC|nr:DEAD/DEAH box helicase [Burkholderia pseudomallei]MDI6017216.1 DEAD/DEAH box helicase [Burkholderia pseudomallei]